MSKALVSSAKEIILKTLMNKKANAFDYLIALNCAIAHFDDEVETKFYKIAKKKIWEIEKDFDEKFLLLFEKENGKEVFYEKRNAEFLEFAEDLANALNHKDKFKESESLMQLSGKVALGYKRYFKQKEVTVKLFVPSEQIYEIKIGDESDTVEILRKGHGSKKDKKKLEKYLKLFPEKIYLKGNDSELNVQISLFGQPNLDLIVYDKDGVTLQNINDVRVAACVIQKFK